MDQHVVDEVGRERVEGVGLTGERDDDLPRGWRHDLGRHLGLLLGGLVRAFVAPPLRLGGGFIARPPEHEVARHARGDHGARRT